MGALPLVTGPAPTARRVHAHFPVPGRQQEGIFLSSGNRWAGRIPGSNADTGSPAHQHPSEGRTSFRGERWSLPSAAFDLDVRAGGCLTGRREATVSGPWPARGHWAVRGQAMVSPRPQSHSWPREPFLPARVEVSARGRQGLPASLSLPSA